MASANPDVVERLQAAYDAHLKELAANKRPTAPLVRPDGAVSAELPLPQKKKR